MVMIGKRSASSVLLNALLVVLIAGCYGAPPQSALAENRTPCRSWVSVGVPSRAVLLCVHGLGLYSHAWNDFGIAMSQLGVPTYAIDLPGFGYLKQSKCDFNDCIEKVKMTLRTLRQANPGKPVFLMGESMGGAVALHVAAESPELINGVISVCSSGERFKKKRTDLRIFLHMLMGPNRKFAIGKRIVAQAAKDNPLLKQEWGEDPLDRMKLSPVELVRFQQFMNENHDKVEEIMSTPVFMVQGTNDRLVRPKGTEELYNELTTPDKQIMLVEDAGHLIFEDGQFSDLSFNEVANWIFEHCPHNQTEQITSNSGTLKDHQVISRLHAVKPAFSVVKVQ